MPTLMQSLPTADRDKVNDVWRKASIREAGAAVKVSPATRLAVSILEAARDEARRA